MQRREFIKLFGIGVTTLVSVKAIANTYTKLEVITDDELYMFWYEVCAWMNEKDTNRYIKEVITNNTCDEILNKLEHIENDRKRSSRLNEIVDKRYQEKRV